MKNKFLNLSLSIFLLTLTACHGNQTLKDGNYEGNYKDDTSSVKVSITVKDGKIIDCKSEERDLRNGKNEIKDENYAKDDADFNYKIAQKAVKNSQGYAKKLIEVQDINQVDSVSGATVSNKRFKEAVKDAFKEK